MRLTLIILGILLLFQTNTQASYVRNRHIIAVKAFVLERKKNEATKAISFAKVKTVEKSASVSQFILWDCEETEEDSFTCDVKFKILSSYYLTLNPLYHLVSNDLKPGYITHERLSSQIPCAKYLAQRSIRI